MRTFTPKPRAGLWIAPHVSHKKRRHSSGTSTPPRTPSRPSSSSSLPVGISLSVLFFLLFGPSAEAAVAADLILTSVCVYWLCSHTTPSAFFPLLVLYIVPAVSAAASTSQVSSKFSVVAGIGAAVAVQSTLGQFAFTRQPKRKLGNETEGHGPPPCREGHAKKKYIRKRKVTPVDEQDGMHAFIAPPLVGTSLHSENSLSLLQRHSLSSSPLSTSDSLSNLPGSLAYNGSQGLPNEGTELSQPDKHPENDGVAAWNVEQDTESFLFPPFLGEDTQVQDAAVGDSPVATDFPSLYYSSSTSASGTPSLGIGADDDAPSANLSHGKISSLSSSVAATEEAYVLAGDSQAFAEDWLVPVADEAGQDGLEGGTPVDTKVLHCTPSSSFDIFQQPTVQQYYDEDSAFTLATNTPEGGICAYASLSYATQGDFSQTFTLRQQIANFVHLLDYEDRVALLGISLGYDISLDEEEEVRIGLYEDVLSALPGIKSGDGYTADIDIFGLVFAANTLGRPIHVHQDDDAVQVIGYQIETEPLHIYYSPAYLHYMGLQPAAIVEHPHSPLLPASLQNGQLDKGKGKLVDNEQPVSDFDRAIQAHIDQVMRPLSLQPFAGADEAVRAILALPTSQLAQMIRDRTPAANRRVMLKLHQRSVPTDVDFKDVKQVDNLKNRRQPGIYLHDATPSQLDGGNQMQDPDERIFYVGKGDGANGQRNIAGMVKRVVQNHRSATHRRNSPSLHYTRVYGRENITRVVPSPLPDTPHRDIYWALILYQAEELAGLSQFLECFSITFCNLCISQTYLKWLSSIGGTTSSLPFKGTNVATGLEPDTEKSFTSEVQRERGLKSGIAERTSELKRLHPERSLEERGRGGLAAAVSKLARNKQKVLGNPFHVSFSCSQDVNRKVPFIEIGFGRLLPAKVFKTTCKPRPSKAVMEQRLGVTFALRPAPQPSATAIFVFPQGNPSPTHWQLHITITMPDSSVGLAPLVLQPNDSKLWTRTQWQNVGRFIEKAMELQEEGERDEDESSDQDGSE